MNCLPRMMLVLALIGVLMATIGVATAEAVAGYRPDLPLTRHHDAGTSPVLLDDQTAAPAVESAPTPRYLLPDVYDLIRAFARRALARVATTVVWVALAVVEYPRNL